MNSRPLPSPGLPTASCSGLAAAPTVSIARGRGGVQAVGRLVVLLICWLSAVPVAAEDNPLKWGSHRQVADWLSTGLVAANVALETVAAVRADDRKHALGCLALRNGIAIGVSELGKRIVHRTRPDGSDQHSWPSEHAAVSMVNGGWSFAWGMSIALGAGELRGAADRHFVSDIFTGWSVGLLARQVCQP